MSSSSSKFVELLAQGYRMRAFYREHVPLDEAKMRGVPEIYLEQARLGKLKAAVLFGPDKQTTLYYFYDEDTLYYVETVIAKLNENATTTVYLGISVSFLQLGEAVHYNLDNLVESMKQVFGWHVERSSLGHQDFDVFLFGQPTDATSQRTIIADVDRKLLTLSLLYRAGIYTHFVHLSRTPQGEFPIGIGPEEQASARFHQEHVDQFTRVFQSPEALRAGQGLQAFYRQTTKVGRLALGWMLLEELFGEVSGYPHILTKEERRKLKKLINEQLDLDVTRKARLIEGFQNPSAFRKSRNEIMAERIANLRGDSYPDTEKIVKAIANGRAEVVHSLKAEADLDISEWEDFIESTVLKYMIRNSGCGTVFLRGR